jgi:tripartite-type tricarboxylate transporter receptor subunit TctC
MKLIRVMLAAAACMVLVGPAAAQYPNKPIRFIVPSGAGGSPDIRARLIAPLLAQALGQAVVVDNRPGANGAIGMREAAKGAPDGHTLFMGSPSQVLQDLLNPDPELQFDRAFEAVTTIAAGPMLWVASAALEARTLGEAIAQARNKPGRLTYASQGPGSISRLAALMIEQAAGISLHEVPYKTMAQEFPDLVSGEIATSLTFYSAVAPHLRSGRVRALAVASQQRLAVLPDVPTFAEAGMAGIEVKGWLGIFVPAGTPKEVIRRLNQELVQIIKLPEISDQLVATGTEVLADTPEQSAAYVRDEFERWGKLIRERGIKAN